MNIKAVTKYQINDYIKSIKVFYLVIILVMAFFGVITTTDSSGNFYGGGGVEGSTTIFLFILGLNSFKEAFLMMLQNGITRKTMFISRLITIFSTSVLMAVIDRFIVNLAGLLNDISDSFHFNGMYEMLFEKREASLNIVAINIEAIVITIGVYAATMIAGYFITVLYYRMNKVLKIVVSIGVPTSILFILPILDHALFEGKLTKAVGRMFTFVFGGETGNPYNLLISCLIFIIVAVGLIWLLIRKAVDKN